MKLLNYLLNREQKSALQAKERMKLMLINDRTDLSPSKLNQLKDELINVISKYIEIDTKAVRVEMTQEGRQQRLIADIPIRSMQRSRIG